MSNFILVCEWTEELHQTVEVLKATTWEEAVAEAMKAGCLDEPDKATVYEVVRKQQLELPDWETVKCSA